jgi:GT2 family glycosyltransferase
MLSFLRNRSQSPSPRPPLRALSWDGRALALTLDTVGALRDVALDLDGSYFSSEAPDASGRVRFEFPHVPGVVEAILRAGRDGAALVEKPLRVRFGEAGVQGDRTDALSSHNELAAAGASRSVPFGVDCAAPEVAIVVPVYDAPEAVERCLDSVLQHTTGRARLIVIDDASPDPAIAPLLARYAALANVAILRNESNRGFTATANRGMSQAGRADVVLLNADTRVGPNWLTGLRRAAYCADDVATATAVSDNAGAFSVPELERENALPSCWTFDETARALWQWAGTVYPELPTGNGFCMYIRRGVLDAVGAFDEAAFPQGYGEENDFCQRASARGLRHLVVGNVLVQHARSLSFGHERRVALGAKGMAVLRERWPNYEADVAATLRSPARRELDWRVRRLFATAGAENRPKIRVLHAGSAIPESNAHDTWRLVFSGDDIDLWHGSRVAVSHAPHCGGADADPTPLDEHIWDWLQHYSIEVVIASSELPPALEHAARALGIPLARAGARDDAQRAVADAFASARSFADLAS